MTAVAIERGCLPDEAMERCIPSQALCEGGVAGVVEGLALLERRLPPPECLDAGREQ